MIKKLLKMLNNIRQNKKTHISKKSILESSFIPISYNIKPRIKKKMKDEDELEQTIKSYKGWYEFDSEITQQKVENVVNEVFEQNSITKKPIEKKEISKIKVLKFDIHEDCAKEIYFFNIHQYESKIEIIKYPTNNCQLSSLSSFANILNILPSLKKDIFKIINEYTCNQVLIDIKKMYSDEMEIFLKEYMDMVIKTPYISTNGSNMVLYIYKWKTDLNFENK